jgi:N-acetylglucosaminyl-diphospho-decaprenol L-rhamnosyltransferase
MNLGAVVVTWNSADQIAACVEALLRNFDGPIVVVDNASQDGTGQAVPKNARVRLVASEENLGFAGGANRGVRELDTDLVLLLNPDCVVQEGLGHLVNAARDGAAGGLLLDENGQAQRGFVFRRFPTPAALILEVLGINRLFPANPINRRYRCLEQPLDLDQEVEQPAGAFLCFRRDAFVTVGGLPESYWPVWFEDVEFCQSLVRSGFRIRYTPKAVARHHGAGSIRKIHWSSKELAWYVSLLRYATRQFGWLSRRLVGLAVAAASVPRALTGILFRHQSASTLGVYARVVYLAIGVIVLGREDERRSPLPRGSALQ